MEEHVLGITKLVNHLLGPLALYLLHALQIAPENPALPIPQHVVMGLVVLLIGTLVALILRSRLSVEKPDATQQIAEMLLTNPLGVGIRDLLEENTGHHALQYVAFVGTVSIFVLLGNLLSVFPFFASPTASVSVPCACAIVTFLYFNWQGARQHGLLHYLLTFAGSPKKIWDWVLALLLFPVEIISTVARLLSLTVRLWANIFASDMIYGIFLSLLAGPALWGWTKTPVLGVILGVFPAIVPLAFVGLHIFVSIVQAYVFTILPSVYIGMATAEEH
jgi:F-type H+-transporting ATPase subunit a